MKITETAARVLVEAFQSGELDEVDMVCIFEDPDDWLDVSDSSSAREAKNS